MTVNSSGDDPALSAVNPFSPTAVARIDGDLVTVDTAAIREARSYLEAYLNAPDLPAASDLTASPTAGNVIAVVGDYGAGKTHLTVELLQHAAANRAKNVHVMYLDARPAGFVELYRLFVEELDREEVHRQVRAYYDEVVIRDLEGSELTQPIAERLREDDRMDVRQVADRIGLGETALLAKVQLRLHQVTRNAAFAAALTLLLRPGFDDAVWRWLSGAKPDAILEERGISTVLLSSEETALEAMGVFALLYGYRSHRFVLVIDELERVLLGPGRPLKGAGAEPKATVRAQAESDTSITAFKKLLSVFAAARGFLVLSGLPELLQVLAPDVQQRIGRVVHMSALTVEETRRLIIESHRLSGQARLEPFTPESVEYLVRLADGIPRRIVRLCYHLFRRAVEERRPVSIDMVQDVARTHTTVLSAEDIRARVRIILSRDGWERSTNHRLGFSSLAQVDEWVQVGDLGSGCGILVTDSVLTAEDEDRYSRHALAIQGAAPGTHTLLVVNGYIDDEVADRLGEKFNEHPLVYNQRSFDEDLSGMVRAMAARIQPVIDVAGEQTIEAVRERVERINRQQANTYSFIEQVAVQLDAMRSATERRLDLVQGDLVGISRWLSGRPTGQPPLAGAREPVGRLPSAVSVLFDAALDSLAGTRQVESLFRQAFTVGPEPRTIGQIRSALRSPQGISAVGVVTTLQGLVAGFRQSVEEWYRLVGLDPRGRVLPADAEQLKTLCRTYDAIYEYVPLYQAGGLAEFTALLAGAPEAEQATRFARKTDLRETLDGLGARVQRTMLKAFEPTNDG